VVTGLFGLSLAPALWPAAAGCALIGYGLILFFATSQAVVQLSASDENRGRIMGIWTTIIFGALPLGNLLAGQAADLWGVPSALRLQGLACVAGALIVLILRLLGGWAFRRPPEEGG
jgi:hypothetical protein